MTTELEFVDCSKYIGTETQKIFVDNTTEKLPLLSCGAQLHGTGFVIHRVNGPDGQLVLYYHELVEPASREREGC